MTIPVYIPICAIGSAVCGLASIVMGSTLSSMSADEADAWTFKGALIVALVFCVGLGLIVARWVATTMLARIEANTAAMREHTAASQAQNEFFKGVAMQAVLDRMKQGDS